MRPSSGINFLGLGEHAAVADPLAGDYRHPRSASHGPIAALPTRYTRESQFGYPTPRTPRRNSAIGAPAARA